MGHWFICKKHEQMIEQGEQVMTTREFPKYSERAKVCKHHCPCYFERGECCNCKAILLHEQDEFDLADNEREERLIAERGD